MRSLKNSEARTRNTCDSQSNAFAERAHCGYMQAMMHRMTLLSLVWMALIIVWLSDIPSAHAHSMYVQQASLEADGHGGWELDARFAFEVKGTLEEALQKGIALYFTTDFKLTRARWYWFKERTLSISRSRRLSYQPLTREYRLSSGGLQLRFSTLEDALSALKHISAWRVIPPNTVKAGQPYTASLRMRLDTTLMPKPFQINALNNQDWNVSSGWMHFTFIARSYARPH